MSNPTDMLYGSYNFSAEAGPIPFLSINKTYLRSDDGTKLGSTYQTTIDGTLTPLPSGQGGYKVLDDMQDALVNAFDVDGQNFRVLCNGSTLISEYPRINRISLDKSNDQWTKTTPYTIDMEWDGDSLTGDIYVDNVSETWNVEFDDQSSYYNWTLTGGTGDNNVVLLRLTHSVSAKGIPHYSGGTLTRQAWEHAKLFCISRLGYDHSMVSQTGVLNLPTTGLEGYNHIRTVQVDELGGSYSVNETWLVANFGTAANAGKAIEDFTATIKYGGDNGLVSVGINGSIQGVETRTYGSGPGGFAITQTKDEAARQYWNNVQSKLYGRAVYAASGFTTNVNPRPLIYDLGINPTRGVYNYSYSYDDRRCNFIDGAIMEDINIQDNNPTDIFTSIIVLGRARGPILQDLNTVTSSSRNVSIELVMPVSGGCTISQLMNSKPTTQVNELLCELQSSIDAAQIFKTTDNDNWNPKTGRYSRQVAWTYSSCTGTPPSTDFCS